MSYCTFLVMLIRGFNCKIRGFFESSIICQIDKIILTTHCPLNIISYLCHNKNNGNITSETTLLTL